MRSPFIAALLTLPLALPMLSCSKPDDLCTHMAARCGGANADNWEGWCRSDCVPEAARHVPCLANDACLLCDPLDPDAGPPPDDVIRVFGLPASEIEYLWTQRTNTDEPVTAATPPTGTAFDDTAWPASADAQHFGAWRALEPVHAQIGDPSAFFCEPGPSLFTAANVRESTDGVILAAERLPASHPELACPAPFCASGPYDACDTTSPSLCPYGDAPESHGFGSASELDRVASDGTIASYGYGHYRAVLRAGGPSAGPASGTVYAFFSQSSEPCESGAPNLTSNTAEIDVELSSSTDGTSGSRGYCNQDQMCFIVSTWTSSSQGLPSGTGRERHEWSAFRYRDRARAGAFHTYGYDWSERVVRFTYDANPDDCDEAANGCAQAQASVAICEHTHYVPRRASPLHFQVWNAWWAGSAPAGTPSEMTLRRVWHQPSP